MRKLFYEILVFFDKTYRSVFGFDNGPPTHDPLAVAIILAPQLFYHRPDAERYDVQVVIDGEHGASKTVRDGRSQCGRTIATPLPLAKEGVRIPTSLDVDSCWDLLLDSLTRAEQAVRTK